MPSFERDSRAVRCAQCGSALAHDQRYCVECGTRRGPLPRDAARRIEALRSAPSDGWAGAQTRSGPEAAAGAGATAARGRGRPSSWAPAGGWPAALWPAGSALPRPQATAVAVLAFLGFGVIVGSAVRAPAPVASSPVLVADVPAPAASTEPAPAESPAGEPATTPEVGTAAVTPKPAVTKPAPATTAPKAPTSTTPASKLPPVTHVFEIVLSEHGFNEAFGAGSSATYLAKTLTSQGELLSNYYAVAQAPLANEIALVSGQGPTPQTDEDCPTFADIAPGTSGAEGQVAGAGCVYPASTLTLADELTSAGKTWKAYIEGIGSGVAAGEAATCRHPAIGAADPDHVATPTDPYVTWRNPFVYFHSLIDGTACAKQDVGLEQLTSDLKSEADTPSLAYIVPGRCHDGSEEPCSPGAPAGLGAADSFLETVVPEIEHSPAYAKGGLIAITFDEAPQSGPNADQSACCETPAYPNLAAVTTTTGTATTSSPGAGAQTTSTTATTTTAGAPATSTTTSSAAGGETTPTGGGGRVGLLLISPYIKPATSSEVFYNHFSLLLSIEELFSLKRLGYSINPVTAAFGRAIYNAAPASG